MKFKKPEKSIMEGENAFLITTRRKGVHVQPKILH